jgi:UDP-N-acetylmuramoyl-L-alanyl-D-glutamate--2,6-diaminopimelate ligase
VHAVLNLDDPFGVQLSRTLEQTPVEVIGYGFNGPLAFNPLARHGKNMRTMHGRNLRVDSTGVTFNVEFESAKAELRARVIGRFNASNLLGVLATLVASGIELREAVEALATIRPVAGRMEKMGGGDDPLIVIDYAHTPDALEKVLTAAREIVESTALTQAEIPAGKITCVFGCGGDRDRGKRPLMGAVVARLADEVVVTSDNPRNEDSGAIIGEITTGISRDNYRIEEDRAKAIRSAISEARKGDVIVIAGKGHETYQEISGRKLPFSDSNEAREALLALGRHQVARH